MANSIASGQAVQTQAELRHRSSVRVGQLEVGLDGSSPIDEQLHRVGSREALEGDPVVAPGQRQGWHGEDLFAAHS